VKNIDELPPDKQLDFWLGAWDVSWGEGEIGSNLVQRVLDGRVIQEDFDGTPAISFQGHSVSVYSPQHRQWQQTWVDTDGNYWHFLGGWEGDRFVLMTDDIVQNRPVKYRMVFYDIARDGLEWVWERSDDGGKTWVVKWQIHYQRRG
jgi:hypothetical protein